MPLNLHNIAFGLTRSVNGVNSLSIRTSTGSVTSASGKQTPGYATPNAFVGSIAGQVLTVTAVSAGKIEAGQAIAGPGVAGGTLIVPGGSGGGGAGVYAVSRPQTVPPGTDFTGSMVVPGDVQSLTYGDLRQMDALNIQGTRYGIYVNGAFDGVVRPKLKGGDLVEVLDGQGAGLYLVAIVLESWPGWCKLGCTLQNSNG